MPLPAGSPTVLSDPNLPTPPWLQNFLARTIHPRRRATFFWGSPYPQEPWISRRECFRLTVMRESARIQLLSMLPPPPTGARRFFWPEPARPREPRAPRACHAPSGRKAGNAECRNNPAPRNIGSDWYNQPRALMSLGRTRLRAYAQYGYRWGKLGRHSPIRDIDLPVFLTKNTLGKYHISVKGLPTGKVGANWH